MKISEINQDLIGKKVSVITTGLRVNGIIYAIYEDQECKGIRVKHEPVKWGNDTYTDLLSTATRDGFGNLQYARLIPSPAAERLEELRTELRAECISYSELVELASLAKFIDPGDVELLEAAGVPENI